MKLASLAAEVHGNHDQVIQDHNETSQVPGDPDFPATKDHKARPPLVPQSELT